MPKEGNNFAGRSRQFSMQANLQQTFHTYNSPIKRLVVKKFQESADCFFYCYVCEKIIKGGNNPANNLDQHVRGTPHFENLKKLQDSIIMAQIEGLKFKPLGMEYLVELAHDPVNEVTYACMLCHNSEENEDILDHFASCQHAENYIAKHLPTISIKIQQTLHTFEQHKKEIIHEVCTVLASESLYFSCMLPTVIFFKEFEENPQHIQGLIEAKLHLFETDKLVAKVAEKLNIMEANWKMDYAIDEDPRDGQQEMIRKLFEESANYLRPDAISSAEPYNFPMPDINLGSNDSEIQQLLDTEIERLTARYDRLGSKQQIDLLRLLMHIAKHEPERFKQLKSPFGHNA